MSNHTISIDDYYDDVMRGGNLRTPDHAARLSFAVLRALGFNLGGAAKRKLAKALPPELARDLTRSWRLINIRHGNLSVDRFATEVARNSGNTDPDFAKTAMRAVFRQIKGMIGDDMSRTVARDLSPEMRAFWNAA